MEKQRHKKKDEEMFEKREKEKLSVDQASVLSFELLAEKLLPSCALLSLSSSRGCEHILHSL